MVFIIQVEIQRGAVAKGMHAIMQMSLTALAHSLPQMNHRLASYPQGMGSQVTSRLCCHTNDNETRENALTQWCFHFMVWNSL